MDQLKKLSLRRTQLKNLALNICSKIYCIQKLHFHISQQEIVLVYTVTRNWKHYFQTHCPHYAAEHEASALRQAPRWARTLHLLQKDLAFVLWVSRGDMCGGTPVIPPTWEDEAHEFKARLDNRVRSHLKKTKPEGTRSWGWGHDG